MGICCGRNPGSQIFDQGHDIPQATVVNHTKLQSKVQSDILLFYDFIRVCGYGQFGTVREARMKQDNKVSDKIGSRSLRQKAFAVKSISKTVINRNLQMLKREVITLKMVDHPNIVRLYEIYEDSKYLHLVMDLCTGQDLLEFTLQNGPLAEKTVASIMQRLFSAVNHMHRLNICHRDIKPENILFVNRDDNADIKLVDFGMAAKYKNKPLDSKVGTPYFIAPEVIQGSYGKECDTWSLGVLMYFLLSCNYPFNGDDMKMLLRNIVAANYSFDDADNSAMQWSNVSFEARDLISKLLQPNSYQRITIKQALQHSFFNQMIQKQEVTLSNQLVRTLTKPRGMGRIQKEILKVLVRNLNESDIAGLKDLFIFLDRDNTGFITAKDINNALINSGLQIASEEVQLILKNFKGGGDGQVKYTEFLTMVFDTKQLVDEENLWIAFKQFDTDNDNKITVHDFRGALEKVGCFLTDQEFHEVVKEFQMGEGDFMDFEQFQSIMMCFSEQQSPESSVQSETASRLSRIRSIIGNSRSTSRKSSLISRSSHLRLSSGQFSSATSRRSSVGRMSGGVLGQSSSRRSSQARLSGTDYIENFVYSGTDTLRDSERSETFEYKQNWYNYEDSTQINTIQEAERRYESSVASYQATINGKNLSIS